MQIRKFDGDNGKEMVEFIRHQYDPKKKRGVAKRLGRFQLSFVRSLSDLRELRSAWNKPPVWESFTDAERVQAENKIAEILDERSVAESEAAQARIEARLNYAPANLRNAVNTIIDALAAGKVADPVALWEQVEKLTAALKKAKVKRPAKVKAVKKAKKADETAVIADERQVDLETHTDTENAPALTVEAPAPDTFPSPPAAPEAHVQDNHDDVIGAPHVKSWVIDKAGNQVGAGTVPGGDLVVIRLEPYDGGCRWALHLAGSTEADADGSTYDMPAAQADAVEALMERFPVMADTGND